jgi:hypothetical protein
LKNVLIQICLAAAAFATIVIVTDYYMVDHEAK